MFIKDLTEWRQLLEERRKEGHLSYQALARQTNMSLSIAHNALTGQSNSRFENMLRLTHASGLQAVMHCPRKGYGRSPAREQNYVLSGTDQMRTVYRAECRRRGISCKEIIVIGNLGQCTVYNFFGTGATEQYRSSTFFGLLRGASFSLDVSDISGKG